MIINQLIDDVNAALGLMGAVPLTQGGQKLVLKGYLGGAPAVAKIVLVPAGPSGDITLQRAHREVELLAAVDSDRVVKVLTDAIELGEPTQAVCWAEEYLDGEDLGTLFSNTWSEKEVWLLLHDVAEALSACHDLEVVHRDLSPGNVRRTNNGRFVLMDPGLARHLEKTALTGAFQPGTPGWRSPEHTSGGNPIPASDIFALGILAFVALSGKFPFDSGLDSEAYDRALLETQAPSISSVVSGVGEEMTMVIDRCLRRQPARRFLDGTELLSYLDELEVVL